jgi:hypothetical protein
VHWVAAKHMLKYLRGIVGFDLRYVESDGVRLHGYSNSDKASSAVDRKSTYGGCFSLGSAMASWFNRKQASMAFTSAGVEYMAASLASCEVIWLRRLLPGLSGQMLEPTFI